MAYGRHFVTQLYKELPRGAVEYIIYHMKGTDFNTFFSGVDAFGSSITCLAAILRDMTGRETIMEPQHISACEKDTECIQELRDHPNPPCCIFGDMEQFWAPSIKTKLDNLGKNGKALNFDTLLPVVKSGKAAVLSGHCLVHNKTCRLKKAKMSVSGVICWDYSPQGAGDGKEGSAVVVETYEHGPDMDYDECLTICTREKGCRPLCRGMPWHAMAVMAYL